VFSSIFARLTIIVVLALTLIVLAVGSLSYFDRGRDLDLIGLLPLPGKVAAIVNLVEKTPRDEWAALLRAIDTPILRVEIMADRPQGGSEDQLSIPGLNFVFSRYLDALPDREVEAKVINEVRRPSFLTWAIGRNNMLRLAVRLKEGGWLVFTTQSELGRRIFGIPPGFFAAVFSTAIAIAAILALSREARPVKRLAGAVERFSASLQRQPLPTGRAREIKSLIAAFDKMQKRIISLIENRTFIVGAVSHDLKTYVTRLRLRVEAIDNDEQRMKAIADIGEMSALIDDALDFTRHAIVEAAMEPVDLSALVAFEVEDRCERGAHIKLTSSKDLYVMGDAVALRRLICNLLDNAEKFAMRAEVSLVRDENGIELIVDDDGPGIPSSECETIFEPFYRLEKSRNRRTGGAGLGLAIAEQIVAAHGGTIRAETSPLGGARIAVRQLQVAEPT
jgi:signal transduction histidine kinase